MKRVVGYLILILVTVSGLIWPLLFTLSSDSVSPAADPVVFTNYAADYQVAADGGMTATETINADFPYGRHGIFHYWDVADPSDSQVRYLPKITAITMDGTPVSYETSQQRADRFFVAKIGDPDKLVVPGDHLYKISYTIAGVISPISAGAGSYASTQGSPMEGSKSDFYWNVVAQGWEVPIKRAKIDITLPAAAGLVQCGAGAAVPPGSTGTPGSSGGAKDTGSAGFTEGPCKIEGAGTNRITLMASDIPPRSGMTVRATMQPPPPPRASVPWPVQWDKVLGINPVSVGLILFLTILAAGIGVVLALRAREPKPGFPVLYAPPPGLGPVQTVYMDTESISSHSLTSSLFHLADRRLVTLERRSDDSWLVTGQAGPDQWAQVDPVTRGVAEKLKVTDPGYWFLADSSVAAGKTLQAATSEIHGDTASWAREQGYMRGSAGEKWGKFIWIISLVGAGLGFFGIFGPTMWGLPFAGYAIGGFGLMKAGVGTRRTKTGREIWSQAGGFRRLLATDSAEARFDFAANRDLFISFVPFAVAFGVADLWAAKYKLATGQEAPLPFWYPYGYGLWGSPYASGGGFDSFDSALSTSIGAYQATQSSSGGGGGGGGFGGGGGGGGGGSW